MLCSSFWIASEPGCLRSEFPQQPRNIESEGYTVTIRTAAILKPNVSCQCKRFHDTSSYDVDTGNVAYDVGFDVDYDIVDYDNVDYAQRELRGKHHARHQ
jgi:hypothetical protein